MSLKSYSLPKLSRFKLFSKNNNQYTDPTQLPLLEPTEIIELRNRTQQELQAYKQPSREAAHHLLGDAQSVFKGSGLDYEESRPYQTGDEPRFINWRLTARSNQSYVKVFREERRPGTFILVDRRASMRFGTRIRLKVTQAARAATVCAFSSRLQNTPVSGVVVESAPHWISDCNDDQSVIHFINSVCKPCPTIDAATDDDCSLNYMLKAMQSALPIGTNVYLISDFVDLDSNCEAVLTQLASEQNVKAIHIIDNAELQLPNTGTLMLQSPGNADAETVDTSDPVIRSNYESAIAAHVETRKRLFLSSRIPFISVKTDTDFIEKNILSL